MVHGFGSWSAFSSAGNHFEGGQKARAKYSTLSVIADGLRGAAV